MKSRKMKQTLIVITDLTELPLSFSVNKCLLSSDENSFIRMKLKLFAFGKSDQIKI